MNRKKKQTSLIKKAALAVTVPGYTSVLSDIVELLNTALGSAAPSTLS